MSGHRKRGKMIKRVLEERKKRQEHRERTDRAGKIKTKQKKMPPNDEK